MQPGLDLIALQGVDFGFQRRHLPPFSFTNATIFILMYS
jgi:hypothetical protein